MTQRGLGRGIGALIPTAAPTVSESDVDLREALVATPGLTLRELTIDSIVANPAQPRQNFDPESLSELVHSLNAVGLLQPIVVRAHGPEFQIVAGERRWRAAQQAGWQTIAAIVRGTSDDDLLREALLENLHRVQLNALEEAAAYQQLLSDFACTQDELADRLGRSRPHVTNTLRLLNLPAVVQRRVADGVLSAGHARALLGLPNAEDMDLVASRIVAEGLSVRATEELVSSYRPRPPRKRRNPAAASELAQTVAAGLSARLDTTVDVTMGAKRGKITIHFADSEDLQRLVDLIHEG